MNTITLEQFDKLKDIASIRLALFGDDTYTETTESTGDERGQLRQVTVTKNLLTDAVVETQAVEWSYYAESGDVDEIVTSKKDGADKPIGDTVTVKHYDDGKQPTVSLVAQAVVIER